VRAHELLEVEVGELVLRAKLKKRGELLVGVNLATIILVLELVVANVSVDLASDLSASHLRTLRLTKEGGKLITNLGRLNKAARRTVASLALLLHASLLSRPKLTGRLLLKVAEVGLERREHLVNSLELGHKLKEVTRNLRNNRINRLLNRSLGDNRLSRNFLLGGSRSLLRSGGLLLLRGRGSGLGFLLLLWHIILYSNVSFLSVLTQ